MYFHVMIDMFMLLVIQRALYESPLIHMHFDLYTQYCRDTSCIYLYRKVNLLKVKKKILHFSFNAQPRHLL